MLLAISHIKTVAKTLHLDYSVNNSAQLCVRSLNLHMVLNFV